LQVSDGGVSLALKLELEAININKLKGVNIVVVVRLVMYSLKVKK
jgi:hypothetical protein